MTTAPNAVPSGFKQSDVGPIPMDWDVTSIGCIAETTSGTTPARANADKYYANGTIPWVKTLDLNNWEIRNTDECVTSLAIQETCLRTYPVGSVLVAMYGGFKQIGRTGLLTIPATVNQAITAIIADTQRVDSRYLLRVLNYRVEYWRTVASSSRKDPNITGREVRGFPFPLPPTLTEQEAIVEALGDADSWIESLERLVAKKRSLKQAAMQQLLTGQRRLPGFEGEWGVRCLRECLLADPDYGINAAGTEPDGTLPAYLRITDFDDEGRLLKENRVAVDHPMSCEYVLNVDELVFARTGASVGKTFLHRAENGQLIFAGFLIRVRIDSSKRTFR